MEKGGPPTLYLEEHDWKVGEKEIWGRDMWIDLSEGAEVIFVSQVNAPQRVTRAEEDFSIQVDRVTILWRAPSHPSPPTGLGNVVAVAGVEVVHASPPTQG